VVNEYELIELILAIGILIFFFGKRPILRKIYAYKTLLWAFCFLFAGFLATVLEGFLFNVTLNYLEHVCYVISSALILIWCWRLSKVNGD